jgi:hypothetical protein
VTAGNNTTLKVSVDNSSLAATLDVVIRHLTALSAELKTLGKDADRLADDIKAVSHG